MKIGIALSGGGIRGIAHAGVLQALEDNNIKIDIIGGTSCGSIIASLYAIGYKPDYIYKLFKQNAKQIAGINCNPLLFGIKSIFSKKNFKGMQTGEKIEKIFNETAVKKNIKTIKDIKMPIVIPTVDILNSKEYIFTNYIPKDIASKNITTEQYITNISLGQAVRASSSFPGVFSPCNVNMHAFMDGGTLDNVPVNEVKKQGADKVIAVKFDADSIDKQSNMMDIIMKTIDIMGSKISEESLEMSDIVLNVYTDKVGLLDFKKLDNCYKYGYECVIQNLEKIKKVIFG